MVFCYCSHLKCADQKKGYIMKVHLWASSSPSFFFPPSFHTIFPHISSLPCVPSFYNVIPDFCWNICVEGWMYSDYILHKVFWWKGNCYPHFIHHICVSPSFWSPYWTKNVLPCKRLFVYWLNGCFGNCKGVCATWRCHHPPLFLFSFLFSPLLFGLTLVYPMGQYVATQSFTCCCRSNVPLRCMCMGI